MLSALSTEIQCGQVRYKLTADEQSEGSNGVKKMLPSTNCFLFLCLATMDMSGLPCGFLWFRFEIYIC